MQTQMKDFDIVVVGGGPSGTSFARSLFDLAPKSSIALLDQASFPRDKHCGDALTDTALPLLHVIFPELSEQLPPRNMHVSYSIRDLNGRGLRYFSSTNFSTIPRRTLDNLLWQAVKTKGIQTFENTKVLSLLKENNAVCGVRAETPDGIVDFQSSLVIGADGSKSTIRRNTGTTSNDDVVTAIRQYVRGIRPIEDRLVFFIDSKYSGYYWFFPFKEENEHVANIGYGIFTPNRCD